MGVVELALAHYRRQVSLARMTAREVARLWARVDRQAIGASWAASVPAALQVVSTAQAVAAASSSAYLDDVLEAQDIDPEAEGRIRVDAFAGVASDGRDLAALLYQPAITALAGVKQGATEARSMAAGRLALDLIVRTQVADAGRVADGVAVVARRQVGGYVRLLSPPSCSRCVVLAGKWYRWNAGFERHPRCDCRHIPAAEDTSEELATDPRLYFDSLSEAEQDRVFTQAGARAIRDGADMSQVVNARRGARGLAPAGARLTADEVRILRGGRSRGRLEPTDVFGHDLFITTEGVTTRGVAGRRLGARETGVKREGRRYRSARGVRLMPESIYQIAGGDRDEAIRLLRRYGFIA
ncbi:hypothetical protein [Micromonospora sp. NBRC 107095]|uniref:VG15 protein n=1 Tax=Micromonospora sp. NBRC 107095 TaxID=3032209 RepID=UPI0024A283C3|nr:hypothetical protein [Micromonospora sp. NBRC 107095]GLZ62868.1 hypothetical protein Misp05_64440 [Micromonospora sp. NBRC 107095]